MIIFVLGSDVVTCEEIKSSNQTIELGFNLILEAPV